MRRPIVSKSERSGTGVDMANLSKAVCHRESDKCRFGNPPQESNFQRLGIRPFDPNPVAEAASPAASAGKLTMERAPSAPNRSPAPAAPLAAAAPGMPSHAALLSMVASP